MDLGQVRECHENNPLWTLTVDGVELRLREGFRARYTFGARLQVLGGKTFEWWVVEELHAPAELAFNGGPLWVAREVTGKECVSAVHARADTSGRIIGRAVGASGAVTGQSTPAQLMKAIERRCEATVGKVKASLTIMGLTHAKIQALMGGIDVTSTDPVAHTNKTIGSRKGGLSELKEGGSQLRQIRRLAGEAFIVAMKSVSPDEPQLVFRELMKSPSFRNTYLQPEWRDGLTPAAIQQQMLETPFLKGMVTVYHELKGYKAKRQHLALFAPHFPDKVRPSSPTAPRTPHAARL
eukprot:1755260-Prymnesium_polylepis.1